MRQTRSTTPSWQAILLLIAGVVIAVVVALLLAQTDSYQRRSSVNSNGLPIVNLEATMAAGDLAVVYLPSEENLTPAVPATLAVATPAAEMIGSATSAARIDSTCIKALDGWSPYIVQAKDSLVSFATQFGLRVDTIVQANCLSRNKIIEGQQIYLPLKVHSMAETVGEDNNSTPWSDGPTRPATTPWPIATPTNPPSQ